MNKRYSADRFKAFVDAVVAIAMTLLILPLMEAVSEASREGLTSSEFLSAHVEQLIAFGLSFTLIAMFWMMHHRLYDAVEFVTPRLRSLNLLWLAAIVWLPVATSMSGQLRSDPSQALVYVGALLVAAVLLAVMRVHLIHHPDLTGAPVDEMIRGLGANLALCICFTVTLVLSIIWPRYGSYGFFLCMLIGVMAGPLAVWLKKNFFKDRPATEATD